MLLPRAVLATLAVALGLASAAAPAAAQSACGAYYTIDTGDTLAEIATRCGVSLPALVAANPRVLDGSQLEVGERLRVPPPGAPDPSPVEACGPSYTIRTGDTLAEIAALCGLSVPMLVAANPPLPEPLGVHAGLVIQIPDLPPTAVTDPATIVVPAPALLDTAGVDPGEAVDGDSTAIPAEKLIRVVGVLEQGPRCMAVRGDDGVLHGIAAEPWAGFSPGERVVLMGVPAAEDACEISPAVELRILYRAPS